eukprot:UN05924
MGSASTGGGDPAKMHYMFCDAVQGGQLKETKHQFELECYNVRCKLDILEDEWIVDFTDLSNPDALFSVATTCISSSISSSVSAGSKPTTNKVPLDKTNR